MNLSRETLQRLFRYGYSLTGDEQDAYELLHHAIERTMSTDVEPEHPVRYLMRAMRNRHIDLLRRAKRVSEVSLEDEEAHGKMLDLSTQVLDNQVIAKVDLAAIWTTLQPEEREILYMWAVEECTANEIATQTQTSRNTILSRIHRLRLKLRKRFGKSQEDAS